MSHYPEPYRIVDREVYSADGYYIACADDDEQYAVRELDTIKRLAACVNACAGVDDITAVDVAEVIAQRDQLLAACKELLKACDTVAELEYTEQWRAEEREQARAAIASVKENG